jgi:hypothetical protein
MSEKEVPDRLSHEWHDYVMEQFFEEEIFESDDGKRYPTTAGLRRVAELLIGQITLSAPSQVFPVEGNELGRATVVYEVVFDVNGTPVKYADVADVWHGNTDDLFLVHAIATACTRAEGRALRKALKLRTLAAEEVCRKKNSSKVVADSGSVSRINGHQINYINSKCKNLDINVVKFINSGSKQYSDVYEITEETAAKIITKIKEFVNDKGSIPEDVKNYSPEWRTEWPKK